MSMRFGRYEVVCKLGEGAMAAVHLARDPLLTRFVAVKVLHGNVAGGKVVLQRFFNEAKTVANVRNPHIVEVFDFGREGKDYFLVMEFVDGQSLHGILRLSRPAWSGPLGAGTGNQAPEDPGEPLDEAFAAAMVVQAAEGLEIAARHGVVHRDIKPENLLINSQGYLKIADFGIAHLQDESLTRTGAVLGSPLYMSPEQVRGVKPITSQSDMFSLGAVLYRCLTGSPPFASKALKDLFLKIAREPHVPILRRRPDLPPGLAGLVETLLQKDPARRGGGPRWLRSELRACLQAMGVDDPLELVAHHVRELSRRRVETTWGLDPAARALPRTVASTSPLDGRTIGPWAGKATEAGTLPVHQASVVAEAAPEFHPAIPRRRTGMGMKAAGAFAALAVTAGVGYLVGRQPGLDPAATSEAGAAGRHGGSDNHAGPGWGPSAKGGREAPASGERVGERWSGSVNGTAGPSVNESVSGTRHGLSDGAKKESADGARKGSADGGARSGEMAVAYPESLSGAGTHQPGSSEEHSRPPAGDSGPGSASLLIQSAPPFAEVFLDGRAMGVTPVRLGGVEAGRHRLVVKGRVQGSVDTVLQVRPGRHTVQVRLEPGGVAMQAEGD